MSMFRDAYDGVKAFAKTAKDIMTSRLGRWFLIFTAAYIALSFFVEGKDLIIGSNLMSLVLALIVFGTWMPYALYVVLNDKQKGSQTLLLGVTGVAGGYGLLLVWAIVYRWLDRPEWMTDHAVIGYLRLIVAAGLAAMIISPSMETGVPSTKRISVIAVVSVVIGIILGMFATSIWGIRNEGDLTIDLSRSERLSEFDVAKNYVVRTTRKA